MKNEVLSPTHATMVNVETNSNQQKIIQLFKYFGKGDLAAIIEMCSEDCDWKPGGNQAIIPFAKSFRGKKGVSQFFREIDHYISVTDIRPSNFKINGNEVSHDFHVKATVKATGKSYMIDVLYIWTFNQEGKICKHRSPGDYSASEEAFKG